jgi:hypothetical protein
MSHALLQRLGNPMQSLASMEHLAPAMLRAPGGRHRQAGPRAHVQAAFRQLATLHRQLQRHVAAAIPPSPALGRADTQQGAPSAAQSALRAAVALLGAVCLQLGGGAGAAQAFNLASVAEDRLLEFVRQVELRVDSTLGAVKDAATLQQVRHCLPTPASKPSPPRPTAPLPLPEAATLPPPCFCAGHAGARCGCRA